MPQDPFAAGSNYRMFMDRARTMLDERHMAPTRMLLALNRSSEGITGTLEQNVHKKHDITWQGFKFLFVLRVMGDLEPHRTAELTSLRRATVSFLASSLGQRDLVTKRPSETDGRSVILSLTDQGRALVDTLLEEQQDWQTTWFSPLTPTEQRILTLLLEKLISGEG